MRNGLVKALLARRKKAQPTRTPRRARQRPAAAGGAQLLAPAPAGAANAPAARPGALSFRSPWRRPRARR